MGSIATRARRAIVGSGLVVAVVATAGLLLGGGSGAGAQVDHVLVASAEQGTPGQALTVSGEGCRSAILTYRWDDATFDQLVHQMTPPDGSWSLDLAFPAAVGRHRLLVSCSDQSTSGSPTTMFGPGTLRFTYLALAVETVAAAPPTTPTAPAVAPSATWQPAPAPVLPGTPTYTG